MTCIWSTVCSATTDWTVFPMSMCSCVSSGDVPMSYPLVQCKLSSKYHREFSRWHQLVVAGRFIPSTWPMSVSRNTGRYLHQKHCPVSGGRAHSGPDTCHQLDWSTSHGKSSLLPPQMCIALEALRIRTECQTMNRDVGPLPLCLTIWSTNPCLWFDSAIAIFIHYCPTDISTYYVLVSIISEWCTHIVSIISIRSHYIIPAHLITCHLFLPFMYI